jgi:hypothetical protein
VTNRLLFLKKKTFNFPEVTASNLATNLRECQDQSWFKVQAVPVLRFDLCEKFSSTPKVSFHTPGVLVAHFEYHCSTALITHPRNNRGTVLHRTVRISNGMYTHHTSGFGYSLLGLRYLTGNGN